MIVFSKWQAELYHQIHVSGYRWSVSWTRDLERGEGSTSAKASFFFLLVFDISVPACGGIEESR